MKKLNKQSKIIIQVTKIGGQYCSNIIEEFNDDILTENECELKTMVRGMIAKMQKDPHDVYMEGIKALAEDGKQELKKDDNVIELKALKKNRNTKLN